MAKFPKKFRKRINSIVNIIFSIVDKSHIDDEALKKKNEPRNIFSKYYIF